MTVVFNQTNVALRPGMQREQSVAAGDGELETPIF